jgi:hypothetical protein
MTTKLLRTIMVDMDLVTAISKLLALPSLLSCLPLDPTTPQRLDMIHLDILPHT